MRGHPSGNREQLSFSAGGQPAGNDNPCDLAVRSDFDKSLPVGPAELDAFEAFLMPQILALLQEKSLMSNQTAPTDSEVPQTSANTWIKAV
jgi:hypothetical protein